jgi:UDP-2-acetamido-3-amino-2,3-dideoxy-glucuronate N-acetyltransferase
MINQIHESAIVDPGAELGERTRIWHFSHICAGARIGSDCVLGQNVYVAPTVVIGNGCKIQNNVSLYDGVILKDDVFVGPSAVFTNVINPRAAVARKHEYRPTIIEKGATIGANATIICGNSIGAHAFVAAGAVVSRPVRPYSLVVGVPAKHGGLVCFCGNPLSLTYTHPTCPEHGPIPEAVSSR